MSCRYVLILHLFASFVTAGGLCAMENKREHNAGIDVIKIEHVTALIKNGGVHVTARITNLSKHSIWMLVERYDYEVLNLAHNNKEPLVLNLKESVKEGCGAFFEYSPPNNARFWEILSRESSNVIINAHFKQKDCFSLLFEKVWMKILNYAGWGPQVKYPKVKIETVFYKVAPIEAIQNHQHVVVKQPFIFNLSLLWLCDLKPNPIEFYTEGNS